MPHNPNLNQLGGGRGGSGKFGGCYNSNIRRQLAEFRGSHDITEILSFSQHKSADKCKQNYNEILL